MNLDKYLFEIQNDSNKKIRYFHLSQKNIKILMPKIPDNMYTKLNLENKTIKRISVCEDIDHALLAIGYNVLNDSNNKIFNVYEPEDYSKIKVLTNKEIINRKLVIDAKQTKESWLLTPTKVKLITKIKVLGPTDKYEIVYQHDPNLYPRAYYWNWKIIAGKI